MSCPDWLVKRLLGVGGTVSFREYMDWVLNDPQNGAYGAGKLHIGKQGDFVTSPSLGDDFSYLLAIQVADWFRQLDQYTQENELLTLVDIGPGEGDLINGLVLSLREIYPALISRIQIILIEVNPSMICRQKRNLSSIHSPNILWKTYEELIQEPIHGVVLAHEVLDALPVERVVWSNNELFRQAVSLFKVDDSYDLKFDKIPLSKKLKDDIDRSQALYGFDLPPANAPEGWTSEWHTDLAPWFKTLSSIIKSGTLLIIDYCLEASRYYTLNRSSGTLLAYRKQFATNKLLLKPGETDLTSHLCLETLLGLAEFNNFKTLGCINQGQALLALGLAERLYSLQSLSKSDLSKALNRRESLLRLVDPLSLGAFKWIAFQYKRNTINSKIAERFRTLFLEEPLP